MKYPDYKRNHFFLPERVQALNRFLKQDYKGMRHKWKNGFNSNSEDALTWSCFDLLSNLPSKKKLNALKEIWEDAYEGRLDFPLGKNGKDIDIFVGKQYKGSTTGELTEVDASIESPDALVFFEAKLYSSVSLARPDKRKPHYQIARKIRIGLDDPLKDAARNKKRDFYFIFLDIAPKEKLFLRKKKQALSSSSKGGFYDKWKSAWLFDYYKRGRNRSLKPLDNIIKDIEGVSASSREVSRNMGWLTWTDLFKDLLRAMV